MVKAKKRQPRRHPAIPRRAQSRHRSHGAPAAQRHRASHHPHARIFGRCQSRSILIFLRFLRLFAAIPIAAFRVTRSKPSRNADAFSSGRRRRFMNLNAAMTTERFDAERWEARTCAAGMTHPAGDSTGGRKSLAFIFLRSIFLPQSRLQAEGMIIGENA